MQSSLKHLPYEAIMRFIERIRMEFFKRKWPEHAPTITVNATHDEIERHLRNKGWESMYLSYVYNGQVLDLRHPYYHKRPMELHIRTRDTENGVEVIGHTEASRYEMKKAHINEEYFEWLETDELKDYIQV